MNTTTNESSGASALAWQEAVRRAAQASDIGAAVAGIVSQFTLPARVVRYGFGWSVWFELPTGRLVRVWSAGIREPDIAECRKWAVEREVLSV